MESELDRTALLAAAFGRTVGAADGQFSLPDAARRLLALPDSPLRAGETLNIGLTAGEDVATLNRVFERMAQTGLQFQRSFRGLLARNEGEISAFLDAIERNGPPDPEFRCGPG